VADLVAHVERVGVESAQEMSTMSFMSSRGMCSDCFRLLVTTIPVMAKVVVYADIVCPFAYVGLTRLLERRHELDRDDVRFRIRSWPLELVNGKPVEGAFIGEEIEEIKPQVAPELFRGFDAGAFPASSLPGLALTAEAYAIDDATGESVAMELRRLLFEEGRDISDPNVLEEVAQRHRLAGVGSFEAVLAEYAEGRALDVVGSPHFFVDGTSTFCPTLDVKRVDGALRLSVDVAAFEELVAICFEADAQR
jgi:predicted DsbA family dithiol-disulfide isomerase